MREKLTRRTIDRLENLAIVLLSCSAIFLLGWVLTMQNVESPWSRSEELASFSGSPPAASDAYRPAAVMLRTENGQYGVLYSQEKVDALYENGLDRFLDEVLTASEAPEEIGEERWKTAVTENDRWLWYDFLYDIPCPGWELPDGNGARGFLVVQAEGKAGALYLYSDGGRSYYRCAVNEEANVSFPELPGAENGAAFLFQIGEELSSDLSPVGLFLPETRDLSVYAVSSPLTGLDVNSRRDLLTALRFNPSAVSLYQTADGTVIREGTDNLRLEKDGTLVYHGSFGGEVRYQAASDSVGDLTERAVELLSKVLPKQGAAARMVCREVLRQEDGETELRFCYLLDGVEVLLPDEVPAARFIFRGSGLVGFTIRARYFAPAEGTVPTLPFRQAAALLPEASKEGGELRLCYRDTGSGILSAGWVLRTETETE